MTTELVVLNEAAVQRLKKAVKTDSDLVVWVGDWLSHLNLFSDAQIYDILRFVQPQVEEFEKQVSDGVDRQIATLVVWDSRWVSFTNIPMFWDTEVSDMIPELGNYAVTHIMCDVAALRARMLYRQGRFNAKPDRDSDTATLHEAKQ